MQGELQVGCSPGNAAGDGHVQQFSYCKHNKTPPKVRLESRKGEGCDTREKESTGAKDDRLESMKRIARKGAAEPKAHLVLALPSKQLW